SARRASSAGGWWQRPTIAWPRASLPIMSSWTEHQMGRGASLQRRASPALCADRPEPGPGDPMTLRQRLLAGAQPRLLQAMCVQAVDLATRDAIRMGKFLPCRRSVLAPQRGVDLEDAMGD